MSNADTIAATYLATWNEPDEPSRQTLLTEGWAADARYADPLMSGAGRDGIATMILAARAQFPGHDFTLRGAPDGHGLFVRFSWDLVPLGGAPVAGGTDIVRLNGDGHIAEVIGFLDGGAA